MCIDFKNFLHTTWNDQWRSYSFFYSQNDTLRSLDSDGGGPKLWSSKLVGYTYLGFTFIASMAYSTWKRRPSGEKVLTPRSYSALFWYILKIDCQWVIGKDSMDRKRDLQSIYFLGTLLGAGSGFLALHATILSFLLLKTSSSNLTSLSRIINVQTSSRYL